MKKGKFITAAFAAVLLGCSKEEMPPYNPWRPETEEEQTIDLADATKVMILTEQAKNRVLMVDQPTSKIAWEWKASDSGLSSDEAKWFDLPDEAKPILDKSCILVTASGGGAAIVRIKDKKLLFYAKPGGNPHSAEVLPDGNIVVASSTGNKLSLYEYDPQNPYVKSPSFEMTVVSGHNVVWDKKRGCLWTAAGSQMLKLSYDRDKKELTQQASYDFPSGNTEAHDLSPVYGKDAMYVTSNQNVYMFDCAANTFSEVKIFQKKAIKSISTGPEGYPAIVMRPTSSEWWSAEVVDMSGNRLFNRTGYEIYKARWYVDNPFGY